VVDCDLFVELPDEQERQITLIVSAEEDEHYSLLSMADESLAHDSVAPE
jgi:hypothetical protein